MTEAEITRMLKGYRQAQGRVLHLQAEMVEITKQLDAARALAIEAAAGPRAQNLDGMPRGKNPGDPTGRAGTMIADGLVQDAEVRALEKRLADVDEALKLTKYDVAQMDIWMSSLMERELMLVNCRLVKGRTWAEVAKEYAERFGDDLSERTLSRMLESAVHQIWLMVEV